MRPGVISKLDTRSPIQALGILAALRIAEEGLAPADAVGAVLRDNLFGLEIDGRCVQIAAFAVALAAWQCVGEVIDLPRPHIAWVGQAPAVGKNEWLRLAEVIAATSAVPPKHDLLGTEDNLFTSPDRWALELLWGLFGQAPVLGSLLDLGAAPPLFAERLAGFEAAWPRPPSARARPTSWRSPRAAWRTPPVCWRGATRCRRLTRLIHHGQLPSLAGVA